MYNFFCLRRRERVGDRVAVKKIEPEGRLGPVSAESGRVYHRIGVRNGTIHDKACQDVGKF